MNLSLFSDIETDRLRLCQIAPEHQEALFRHFADPDVSRFLMDSEPFSSPEEAGEMIDWYTTPLPRSQHRWVLLSKQNGAFMGTCGYHCWDDGNHIAELGYDLAPAFWGHGYMSEALTPVLHHGFSEMQLNRVQAFVYPENERSRALLLRLGFTIEGVFRDKHFFRGQYYDHEVYSLLCREWRGAPAR